MTGGARSLPPMLFIASLLFLVVLPRPSSAQELFDQLEDKPRNQLDEIAADDELNSELGDRMKLQGLESSRDGLRNSGDGPSVHDEIRDIRNILDAQDLVKRGGEESEDMDDRGDAPKRKRNDQRDSIKQMMQGLQNTVSAMSRALMFTVCAVAALFFVAFIGVSIGGFKMLQISRCRHQPSAVRREDEDEAPMLPQYLSSCTESTSGRLLPTQGILLSAPHRYPDPFLNRRYSAAVCREARCVLPILGRPKRVPSGSEQNKETPLSTTFVSAYPSAHRILRSEDSSVSHYAEGMARPEGFLGTVHIGEGFHVTGQESEESSVSQAEEGFVHQEQHTRS